MSDVDDVVIKPIKRISSQKILEKLDLIEKKINELLTNLNLNQLINQWIKILMCIRIREMFMSIN